MTEPLAKAYEPGTFEEKWYRYWNENGLFHANVVPGKPRFSLVIPPPNVTGSLHIGHALDETIQDGIIRYNRMMGKETLWLPGSDHASIATHAKIEELLASEGTSRWELGREKFMERAWAWKEKYGHIIDDQLKALGSSCDWSRQRFTMDEGCSRAVAEVFVRLYEKGLIYKGNYMVNFCPSCRTVISDIEVEHEEEEGSLWYIRYPLEGSDAFLQVATTRPETMLGDTAIAVSPKDARYADLIGKYAVLPVVGRRLPIIQDEHVDPAFGTGAVKVTPAHDPDDFEMGRTHNLESISVIGIDGRMTPAAGKYAGMDKYECRKALLEELQDKGFLVRTEPYKHSVGHCTRCDSTVEPLISEQWFVRMKPLAEPALRVVREGKVKFVPERFTKVYENWMENVRDWCISRQLWWGHRIPAWYCQDCGEVIVAKDAPEKCPKCGGSLRQDEDVLDTWFSSGLWPFSTLGWPEKTADLEYFFPTDVLVTGYDIIFFWVARMIFLSMEFMGREPFHHVVIHGMVRDAQGRKMSKSLGNGIDPLDVVRKYGADALRISLTAGTAMGNDMRLYNEKVEGARNFCNKLWNAARYCLMSLEGWVPPASGTVSPKGASSRWILSRLERTTQAVKEALDRYEPGDAIGFIMDFIWNEFCDWYIEISKQDLASEELAEETKAVLWTVLKDSLALLHPFAPFITEELWDHLPGRTPGPRGSLIVSDYPAAGRFPLDPEAEAEMGALIEATKAIRNMRAEVGIPTGKKAKAIVIADDPAAWARRVQYIERLAWAEPLEVGGREAGEVRQALASVMAGAGIYLPLSGLVDVDKEIARLEKSIAELSLDIERTGTRLQDQAFLARAPQEIVLTQRKRFEEEGEKVAALKARIEMLRKAQG